MSDDIFDIENLAITAEEIAELRGVQNVHGVSTKEGKSGYGKLITLGSYREEIEACNAFDEAIGSKFFHVFSEVCGQVLHPKFGCEKTRVRIDRILVPSDCARQAGWEFGCIGVEIKKSNQKAGPFVAQSIDYMRSAFTLPTGNVCVLNSCFLWPLGKQYGDIASILVQQRIGGAYRNFWDGGIEFVFGNLSVFSICKGKLDLKNAQRSLQIGRKTGSR